MLSYLKKILKEPNFCVRKAISSKGKFPGNLRKILEKRVAAPSKAYKKCTRKYVHRSVLE